MLTLSNQHSKPYVRTPGAEARFRAAHDLLKAAHWKRGAEQLAEALRTDRGQAIDWIALAAARQKTGDIDGSLEASMTALDRQPSSSHARMLAALALSQRHRFAETATLLEAWPAEVEKSEEYWRILGDAYLNSRRPREAVSSFLKVLEYRMDHEAAFLGLCQAFRELKLYEEAVECLRTVVALVPKSLLGHAYIAHLDHYACRWGERDKSIAEFLKAIREASQIEGYRTMAGSPFVLVGLPHHPEDMLMATRLEAASYARGVVPFPPADILSRPHGGKVRVGYLSNDFFRHATALLITEVFERRDREHFEVYLYSYTAEKGSDEQKRLMAACERFVDVVSLSAKEIAEQVRADGIDILVDLKGYTAGSRLSVFAYRPAPVQVSFLGFPGTSGADYMDYIIGDPVVTPLSHAHWYTEKIAQMPVCYQPNDRKRPLPQASNRAQFGLPKGAFVFACFNQLYKLTPEVFDAWCRILHAVPEGVLWLLGGNAQAEANLRQEAEARGISAERLIFGEPLPPAWHSTRLAQADLMLDTWPCNAHTTASDALWAGVPLVTLSGLTFASRVAGSLLNAVGLGELTCESVESYVETAVSLARHEGRLRECKEALERARYEAPLFDSEKFAAGLESLYLRMMRLAIAGKPAEHLLAHER
ncbi:tetratricopeptide repeat protein [Caldimonas tepidiphila]|uniref:O-linked N-acetylglucosamine transferase, SPINDLY family protein n=1 Tax=Caldimonas tepidiphila TaxID=2315841 RepID=UPI000E5B57A6|nr:tetratricopeptide repeat protein [Caldimonas tepidiphila]